jgi:hypothetical protein
MKILHVGNIAHVPEVIAKYMDKFHGTSSVVLERKGRSPYLFVAKVLGKAISFDVVHIHYDDKLLPFFRWFYPKKRLVIHYHGDDIRNKWSAKRKFWKHADLILYSVLDLEARDMPLSAFYLPNPVDEELFHKENPPADNSALTFSHYADDLARELAEQYGLDLSINERNVPYEEMPFILRRYAYYIEVKRNFEGIRLGKGDSVSVVALQALACGLKVVKWDGKLMLPPLPYEHRLEYTCRKLMQFYHKME